MQYLIIGASGNVGSYIYTRLKAEGITAIGTRHGNKRNEELLPFDITLDSVSKLAESFTGGEKTAIVCTAVSKIDQCAEEYEYAYEINVKKTKQLIQELQNEGFYVIYFSTDNVFDGTKGGYTEEDKTCAVNAYGRMKVEMEQYLQKNIPSVCIFRISKVVSTLRRPQNVFCEWETAIEKKEIRCIKDNIISFIAVEDIYQACILAASRKMSGLYHIAGDDVLPRKTLALRFYQALGISDVEIREVPLALFGFKEARPLNVSMSNEKFKKETGYCFTGMDQVIQGYRKNNRI